MNNSLVTLANTSPVAGLATDMRSSVASLNPLSVDVEVMGKRLTAAGIVSLSIVKCLLTDHKSARRNVLTGEQSRTGHVQLVSREAG